MKLLLLDIMRSSAIILLLIAHIGQTTNSPLGGYFGVPNFYYVSLGGLAVTIFLVLSGMCLELNHSATNVSFIRFMFRRILRIYPIYYMSLLVGLVVVIFKLQFGIGFHLWETSRLFSMGNIVGNISGLSIFWGGGGFVSTAWFISLIVVLYILYPALSAFIKSARHITIVALLVISVVSRLVVGQYETIMLNWFPLCRVFEFGLGVYLAYMLKPATIKYFNKYAGITGIFRFISCLSFPLFLVHYPLLFIFPCLLGLGIFGSYTSIVALALFLTVSVILSWAMLVTDGFLRERLLRAEPVRSREE